jgi:non-heme chloroperoxidase
MNSERTPVVFIHGLWLHSSSWQNWVELFTDAGYQTATPEWPGVSPDINLARTNAQNQEGKGLAEIIASHAEVLASFDTKPIVIGHSFGGLVAQSLLGQNLATAAVAIDPAQIKGVLPLPLAQLRSSLPVLGNPLNRNKTFWPNKKQFRYAFGNALTPQESEDLHDQWTIPSTNRPLFDAAIANFAPNSPAKVDVNRADRGPLLIISGTQDHTVPDVVSRAAFKLYSKSPAVTEFRQFNRGHSISVDHGWREIADASLEWLKAQGL